MRKFPALVATVELKFFDDCRKIFFGDNEVFGHKPEALKTIFAVGFMGATQPFRQVHG